MVDNDNVNEEVKIIIWINGKEKHHAFTLVMTPAVNTMKKLKEAIIFERNLSKNYIDKMILYNYKGIEMDDLDIPYLTTNQTIYLSLEGQKFNLLNYVDEYEFIKTLKTGGYAEVYLAKHALTNQLVSIKKTDLHNFSTEELYNISREAVYLSTLIHKNIIKMLNSYTYNDCLYNVMEYAEGGELSNLLIDNKPIPEDNIKSYFLQIVNAVKFIHSKNVIHRDLKPNNILFLDKELTHIVIIDFGISGNCNGMSQEVIKAGTVRYVPPELASGDVYSSSPKMDIWSLGIILYLMYFKVFPFEGNDNDILEKIANSPVSFPAKVKIRKTLIPLIEGMLRKNPNARMDLSDPVFDEWYNDESNDFEYFEEKKEMNAPKTTLFTQSVPKGNKNGNSSNSGYGIKKNNDGTMGMITMPNYLKPTSSRTNNLQAINNTLTSKIKTTTISTSPSKRKGGSKSNNKKD